MKFILRAFLVAVLLTLGVAGWLYYQVDAEGPLIEERTVVIPHGSNVMQTGELLVQNGVIAHAWPFLAYAVISKERQTFKAGEYAFPAGITVRAVSRMLATGKTVVHKLTLPEGLTVREVIALLTKEPLLAGDINGPIAEGSLLPETYFFSMNDERSALIARMQSGMAQVLQEAWSKHKEGIPVETPEQALILASIVEKETGVDTERPRVAAVFSNRLKLGMKLQSDPTTIYAIEQFEDAPFTRALTLDDLKRELPHNTYAIIGLPPTPICNPGRAAIEAVMNPLDSDELYFVATGSGGHHFAATLKDHARNVQSYRESLRKK